MKILFVSSGNSEKFEIAPFIFSQGESLRKLNIDIDYFTIKGKGFSGYFRNISKLHKQIKSGNYNLIHAHYVLSAWVALLSRSKLPLICSFMGSDTYGDVNENGKILLKSYREIVLAKIIQPFLSGIIVKSDNLLKYIWLKNKSFVIPNGIDLSFFRELDRNSCREKLKLDVSRKYILFLGNINNPRKNFNLLKNTIEYLNDSDIEIINPYPVEHKEMPFWINSADVLVLTSWLEGSPNVIKEAMACNCPIVSTDVGDVRWVLGETEGCYIAKSEPKDLAKKIQLALDFGKKTDGRKRVIDLGLDSETAAEKLVNIYNQVLEKRK
mgnify:CR=1 FL=1